MEKQLNQVREFNEAFNVHIPEKPTLLSYERSLLRLKLIKEEVNEYDEGLGNKDIVNIASELSDILYVTYGAILEHGLANHIERVFDAIHTANMAKLGGETRDDGKIMKPEGWKPADVESIIKGHEIER